MTLEPDKLDTEKMYEGVIQIFERLLKRFITFEKQDDDSQATLDYLTKLAGSLGYMAQVHSGLAKAYQHEKRLADLEKKFEKIPPELLKEILNKGR
ncbi:MAG: hypothetical protein IIB45_00645 [Candidatus Marinimicrobia bacterium]|nr:hypothetical protein [Candidatus Neomarinimicrobiota bacterium]